MFCASANRFYKASAVFQEKFHIFTSFSAGAYNATYLKLTPFPSGLIRAVNLVRIEDKASFFTIFWLVIHSLAFLPILSLYFMKEL